MSFNKFMHRAETVALIIAGLAMFGIAAHFEWLYVKPAGVPMLDVAVLKWVAVIAGIMGFTLAGMAKQRAQGLRF